MLRSRSRNATRTLSGNRLLSKVFTEIETLTYFGEKCFKILTLISKSGTKGEFRCRNRNSDSKITIRIEIPMSKLKPKFRYRNRNFGKAIHTNFYEIRVKFCRNFDFVESKRSKSAPKLEFRFQYRKIETSKFRRNWYKVSSEFRFCRK
jgi:hypothetical protein